MTDMTPEMLDEYEQHYDLKGRHESRWLHTDFINGIIAALREAWQRAETAERERDEALAEIEALREWFCCPAHMYTSGACTDEDCTQVRAILQPSPATGKVLVNAARLEALEKVAICAEEHSIGHHETGQGPVGYEGYLYALRAGEEWAR